MSSAAAWRDLERRFRDLQPGHSDGLRAEWSEPEGRWHLTYPRTDIHILSEPRMEPLSVRRRFKSAAARAAVLLRLPRSQAHDAWLDYLRRENESRAVIARVCEVSADLCERLADQADADEAPPFESSDGKRATKSRKTRGKRQPRHVAKKVETWRRHTVAVYKDSHSLTAVGLALRFGISKDAINGIIREDQLRFGEETQLHFLKQLGVSLDDWYGE